MEKSKWMGPSSSSASNSTSSIALQLFGPKESLSSSSSSSSSSTSIFGSVFGPPPTVRGGNQCGNTKYGGPEIQLRNGKEENSKEKNSYYQQETIEPACYFSSSIHYGGQEVYSPTALTNESHLTFKKGEQDEYDPNSALRGNWWQGMTIFGDLSRFALLLRPRLL